MGFLFVILVYKLETFTNYKEVKITIMIIAIIYIFYIMKYLIISWKLLSENPQLPPEKIYPTPPPLPRPFFTHCPTKNPKSASPYFLSTFKIFLAPPAERGGGGHYAFFSKNGLILPNFGSIN